MHNSQVKRRYRNSEHGGAERVASEAATDDGLFGPLEGEFNGAFSVRAADLDSDGDLDLLVASQEDGKVAWLENDGLSPPTFTPRVISAASPGARWVLAADLDGDGDLDVASAAVREDEIAWYESDGGAPPVFTVHLLTQDPDGYHGPLEGFADEPASLEAADLDGDGDLDLLFAARGADRIGWLENDGSADPSFRPWTISVGELIEPNGAMAADLDGDGDLDVVANADRPSLGQAGSAFWFRNLARLPHGRGGKR